MTDESWVSVSICNGTRSTHRHDTKAEAQQAKDRIDRIGCGSRCTRMHWIERT